MIDARTGDILTSFDSNPVSLFQTESLRFSFLFFQAFNRAT
jgi:hypothetical protein